MARILTGKPFERLVDRGQISGLLCGRREHITEGHANLPSGPLYGTVFARMVHQNPPHLPGRHTKELGAVLPVAAVTYESQICFVHKGSGLESVVRPLPAHVDRCPAAQLTIDQGDQLGFGGTVALTGCAEEASYDPGVGHVGQLLD
ncbi:hypothetical protein SBA4_3200030 [Candidatus Sulfopaludibacter sp. SbA4]|nr:hypothetical protein SBA4_3200030 [Candidatus Sulfopaludibacter sp. SbA4]